MNIFRQFKRYVIYRLRSKINIDQNFLNEDPSLDKLFKFYNCDKASIYISKDKKYLKGHGYGPLYEKHLKKFKYNKVNILEIGSYSGGSSASFANFFHKANIFCLDINLTNFKYSSKKFKVFGLDISDNKMVKKFFIKNNIKDEQQYFDIIIDDCSHKLSDQINSFFFFFNYLKNNGIYVIEEYKFPNLYPHLNDCKDEYKIDEILNFIMQKKVFNSNILKKRNIVNLIGVVKKISTYKGYRDDSDIAFIEKK